MALITSGPGMTNVITSLADAYMDSVPIVVFSGQVPTALIGNDAFQEADNIGLSRPCTKYNFLVKDVKDLAQTIKEAFYIATIRRLSPFGATILPTMEVGGKSSKLRTRL